jgi:hypothetical protein
VLQSHLNVFTALGNAFADARKWFDAVKAFDDKTLMKVTHALLAIGCMVKFRSLLHTARGSAAATASPLVFSSLSQLWTLRGKVGAGDVGVDGVVGVVNVDGNDSLKMLDSVCVDAGVGGGEGFGNAGGDDDADGDVVKQKVFADPALRAELSPHCKDLADQVSKD